MNYGKAMRVARAIAGLQQKEVARRSGINASHICLLEAGKRKPSARSLERICRALEIPSHLFMLLGAEAADLNIADQVTIQRAAESLAHLLLSNAKRSAPRRRRRS